MKPIGANENEKGLLEYLEDIIGSHRYAPMIETALQRLEELSDARQESLSRVKLVERERNSLKVAIKLKIHR